MSKQEQRIGAGLFIFIFIVGGIIFASVYGLFKKHETYVVSYIEPYYEALLNVGWWPVITVVLGVLILLALIAHIWAGVLRHWEIRITFWRLSDQVSDLGRGVIPHDPAVSSPEYYPKTAPNAEFIG